MFGPNAIVIVGIPSFDSWVRSRKLGAAGDEEVGLAGQIGAGGLVEVDHRQPVLAGDLVEALALLPGGRVGRAAADRHVGAGDRALDTFDRPMPVGDAHTDRVLGAPRGERAEFEERRVGIDQRFDPLAHQHLAAFAVPVDVALPADRRHLRPAPRRPRPTAPASRPGSPCSRPTCVSRRLRITLPMVMVPRSVRHLAWFSVTGRCRLVPCLTPGDATRCFACSSP